MCSDPQTKADSETGELFTFACRRCDECIATRRHGWVARAMMEKASSPFSASVTLTYSDDTQRSRDGAAIFSYVDVREFMSRLRRAARYEAEKQGWGFVPSVRFLCAGEQGDRNGRCHWHIIIFSNFDLARIGKFRRSGVLVMHRRDMISEGKRKRRLNWSLWPHGFMTLQEPDQAGMNYVLSYCLKDQFTGEKSFGTMREAKSENFATGLFRMSKRPAIGEAYFYSRLAALDETHSVLPALKMTVPGFRGYYVPSGSFREKMLWALVALNRRAVWATGRNAPQWPSLISSCGDNQSDLEVLLGPQKDSDESSLETDLAFRARELADQRRLADFRENCGGALPCIRCLRGFSDGDLLRLGLVWTVNDYGEARIETISASAVSYDESRRARGDGINPLCQRRGDPIAARAFPRSGSQ